MPDWYDQLLKKTDELQITSYARYPDLVDMVQREPWSLSRLESLELYRIEESGAGIILVR